MLIGRRPARLATASRCCGHAKTGSLATTALCPSPPLLSILFLPRILVATLEYSIRLKHLFTHLSIIPVVSVSFLLCIRPTELDDDRQHTLLIKVDRLLSVSRWTLSQTQCRLQCRTTPWPNQVHLEAITLQTSPRGMFISFVHTV
jgi:hypothetical protein